MDEFIGILLTIIAFELYSILGKIKELDDDFNSWYGDWQKKYDPYDPPSYE